MLAALKLDRMKYSNMRNWFNYRGPTSDIVAKFIYAMRGMFASRSGHFQHLLSFISILINVCMRESANNCILARGEGHGSRGETFQSIYVASPISSSVEHPVQHIDREMAVQKPSIHIQGSWKCVNPSTSPDQIFLTTTILLHICYMYKKVTSTEQFHSSTLVRISSIEFGIPVKLVRIIKMCLNETYSEVCIGIHLSDNFPIQNGLKQGDALSSLLIKFALEYAVVWPSSKLIRSVPNITLSF
jgi:hypothetical protein